jgi:hypothetical protein
MNITVSRNTYFYFSLWRCEPTWARAFSFLGFLAHTRHTTVGRAPLDELSVRRRDLYPTTHNTHNRHPCPRRDSNLQSQKASGRRPKPKAARLPGRAIKDGKILNLENIYRCVGTSVEDSQAQWHTSVLWVVYTAHSFRTFLSVQNTSHLVFVQYRRSALALSYVLHLEYVNMTLSRLKKWENTVLL